MENTSEPEDSQEKSTDQIVDARKKLQEYIDIYSLTSEVSQHQNPRNKLTIESSTFRFEKDFDLVDQIKKTPGPFLELGGPTENEAYMDAISESGRKMLVSNLHPGRPFFEFDGKDVSIVRFEGLVDLQTDATKIAVKDGSLGLIYASALPVEIKDRITDESKRALKDRGLFIVSNVTEENVLYCLSRGFALKELVWRVQEETGESKCDAVFVKR